MLEKLKNEVYNANLDLVKNGLVIQTRYIADLLVISRNRIVPA